jgi:DNA adenine methylase
MGSKARHAVELIAITCANRRPGQHYIEPMVGGGNVICKVPRADGPRIANDINSRMVTYLDALGNHGYEPPASMTKIEWSKLMKDPNSYPPELVAFAATCLTFGSVWMGEYVKEEGRCLQGRNGALRDAPGLTGITFYSMPYDQINPHIPPESIIYCDPPYANTTIYEGAKTKIAIGESLAKNTWKPLTFWKWADALVDEGHRVYVSEYKGPPAAIYSGMTPALRAESDALRAAYRASAADPASPASLREELSFKIADVDARVQAGADALAMRWRVMWEKEVVSDFSSVRTEENSGKREVERLFHREP